LNILIVHEVSYLSKIIYEFQILAETLAILGHDVTIVDYDDTWETSANGRRIDLKTKVHAGVHRAYGNASVTVRRPGMIRLPLISRISAAATTYLELERLFAGGRFDVVLLYGLPTVGVQTLLLARRYGVPIHFRSIDILHRLVPSALLVPATKLLEGFVYRNVDTITAVTPHLKRYVESYDVPNDRVRVLPSGVDTALFSPGSRDEAFLASYGVAPGQPVALFMGTIYRFSGLDRVIQGWPRVLSRFPGAKLMIAGIGEDEPRLKAIARDTGVSQSIVFTGLLPYNALPTAIRSSDVCINPFELNAITRDILPTKLFQYLCCGKPVVATRLPGTSPFLAGEEHGVCYAELPVFVDTLIGLMSNPERVRLMGANGARSAAAYDWTGIAERLVSWVNSR
jgi:glycosyltransferase involved in cell wall biosynthesis